MLDERFDRAVAAGNDLGLFSEECEMEAGELRGNFPPRITLDESSPTAHGYAKGRTR